MSLFCASDLLALADSAPLPLISNLAISAGAFQKILGLAVTQGSIKTQASNVDFGADRCNSNNEKETESSPMIDGSQSKGVSDLMQRKEMMRFILYLAGILGVLMLAAFVASIFTGGPSAFLAAITKSGFTAAFTLIFVSEIGDKTFFIAALLAMQYSKGLVLLGSMGALSLMTIISVVIGRIFQSVPSQFQTTLPIGQYVAVALLIFFGIKSIKDAMELPPESGVSDGGTAEPGELAEAEELVKTKVSKKLSTPAEILWKSFSLVFFAEWGDRSMLATIALGVAQSPWGVASGAIGGHLIATAFAILGGGFLARYISEKAIGYAGGLLFLGFAVATLFGAF
eukprot:TRINITY_DN9901_c0_g1_i1.p1 TRINITY_DN9901_c0_g1~~TRINITY_DN9901_c0_g1_i1.p1  ORF type:complete len:342 (-),score=73.62 TRINITY_DN9901_c0_g1_i1:408-1433(-)